MYICIYVLTYTPISISMSISISIYLYIYLSIYLYTYIYIYIYILASVLPINGHLKILYSLKEEKECVTELSIYLSI